MAPIELHHTVVVPTEHAEAVCEILESAVDAVVLRSIPVEASEIEQRCIDSPEDADWKG